MSEEWMNSNDNYNVYAKNGDNNNVENTWIGIN
jgi:hypothetical protein